MTMIKRYKIRERRHVTILAEHLGAEFERVHPVGRTYEVETYELPPVVVVTTQTFAAAERWIKKHGGSVGEVFA